MIKNQDIDGILIVYNEDYYFENEFLNNDMLIYKLSFPDETFYIGKTCRKLIERLNEHIYGELNVDKKISEYKWVKVNIIDFAENEEKLSLLEKKYIKENCKNKNILNEILYDSFCI